MSWKKSLRAEWFLAGILALGLGGLNAAPVPAVILPPAPRLTPAAPPIKATDADNHTIVLNKPGFISVIIGTSEDSQDAARRAGRAMYPFQGITTFQLIVVVDLRDSIASWVPSVVIDHMRRSLDGEAVEIKPYYLKNGNTSNPRRYCHVVPDFKGTIVPQMNWTGTPDQLHATVYGTDGREIKRWENVDNMDIFQGVVRTSLQKLEQSNRQAGITPPRPR